LVGVKVALDPLMKKRCLFVSFLFVYFVLIVAHAEPIRPKVIILTTFEAGADTGDAPGELQYWVEREKLTKAIEIPGVAHPLLYNDAGVFAMVTGTCNRSGLAVMALGLDPRFDLTKTYWLTAGIAGVDADKASVGSAAWVQWVVDGDNVHEIDGHDAPADWPYGIFAYGSTGPLDPPGKRDWSQKPMVFELNPKLVAWAFALTKDIALMETPETIKFRSTYAGQPNAQRPPFVLLGDTLGTARYWHGPALNAWANNWVKMYTQRKGNFVMTQCEDQSIGYAMYMLGKAGRLDPQRHLVLRTASNYSTPPRGGSVVESVLSGESTGTLIAADSCWRIGSPVVHVITRNWERFRDVPPGE
jgi:purine nucleoside permease